MLIRFKKNDGTEYPQWEEFKLSQLEDDKYLSLNRGKVIPKTEPKGNYPVYSSSVKNNGLLCCIDKYMFDKELISWSIDGGGNFFYRPPHKYSITNVSGYIDVIALNKINCKFLYYVLTTKHAKLHFDYLSKAHPSVIRDLYLVPIPCIEEQQKIADFLSTVDQKIEKQKSIVADYEELKKGTMQKIFNQEIRFKDDDGNEFPEWEEKKLKNICADFIVPMRDKPKEFKGNIPWCRIEDIEGKFFNDSLSKQYVNEDIVKKMNLKIHPEGTVICSCSASLGTYAIANQPLVTNQTFIGLVCGNGLYNHYLYYFMSTQTPRLKVIAGGTTIPYISRDKFENYKISLPCLKEQKKIADCLSALDRKIEFEKKILADLEELKKGLLQAIFNN